MRILKFGGSSVGTPDAIKKVVSIIEGKQKQDSLAVVVSAFRGVTDSLLRGAELAASGSSDYNDLLHELEERHINVIRECISVYHQSEVIAHFKMTLNELEDILTGVYLVRELTPRMMDFIVSFGERFSAYILSCCLIDSGVHAGFADAREFVKTDIRFGSARVLTEQTYRNIREYFETKDELQVVTGFIASTEKGETSTLGRGGSDYTASILGAALGVNLVEIWTDVNGLMTADPRKVKQAFTIPELSYEEAMELSHFGAKVIYPPTLQPAMKAGIPIVICNTFDPEFPGTRIEQQPKGKNGIIKGLSSVENIALVTIRGSGMIGVSGIAARIFKALAEAGINIIMITQASSEHTICLAILSKFAKEAQRSIEEEFRIELMEESIDRVLIEDDMCIIAVVGDHMQRTPGIAGLVFQAMGKKEINIVAIAQGSSERNISFIVNKNDEAGAMTALHDAFFSKTVASGSSGH